MKNIRKEITEWIVTLAAALALVYIINIFGFFAIVEGPSMLPTLHDNDILIRANYRSNTPQFGDIIVFQSDMPHPWKVYEMLGVKKNLVKRVIGLPGDKVVVTGGTVYLNDKELQEGYLNDGTTNGEANVVVPEGYLFVMGDNRLNSNDSRGSVGLVSDEDVLGKVVLRLFPWNTKLYEK